MCMRGPPASFCVCTRETPITVSASAREDHLPSALRLHKGIPHPLFCACRRGRATAPLACVSCSDLPIQGASFSSTPTSALPRRGVHRCICRRDLPFICRLCFVPVSTCMAPQLPLSGVPSLHVLRLGTAPSFHHCCSPLEGPLLHVLRPVSPATVRRPTPPFCTL